LSFIRTRFFGGIMRFSVRLFLFAATASFFSATGTAATINILPGAGLTNNAAALGAFNRAANAWESVFSDPVDVYINADLGVLGAGVIGSASNVLLQGSYSLISGAMISDASNESDDAIVASLPAAAQFSANVPSNVTLGPNMVLSKANAKALGFSGLDAAFGAADATITFNSGFGFDYDNSDGVVGIDFESVALHEIGHALGFTSSIDYFENRSDPVVVNVFPLDLFRFNIASVPAGPAGFTGTPRELRPGQNAVVGDGTNWWRMSTGVVKGDGRQASHWKDDAFTGILIGALDPNISAGATFSLSSADIRALDLIGWDVQSVPEPGTLGLIAAGVGMIMYRRRGSPCRFSKLSKRLL
jgi:hypothetical protein